MIRLALAGFGAWGRNYLHAAREAGNAEVVQVVLRKDSPTRKDPLLAGLEVICRGEDIRADAAVVATHPKISPWLAQAFLANGLPVMIEKPAALSLDAARALSEASALAALAGMPVLVAHQHLFSERIDLLRGAHHLAPLCARWHGPRVHDFGDLWDYGSHAISAILALRGRLPDRVQRLELGYGQSLKLWYGEKIDRVHCVVSAEKTATICAETQLLENSLDGPLLYDGYAPAEPPLTRAVRAFAAAVEAGGTTDWRFGASWAVEVAQVLEGKLPQVART